MPQLPRTVTTPENQLTNSGKKEKKEEKMEERIRWTKEPPGKKIHF